MNEGEQDDSFEKILEFLNVVKQERLSPGLLVYEKALFDRLHSLLQDQRIKLKDFLGFQDEQNNISTKNFKYMIYTSQIEKVDYLLKIYLKTRLKKIQQFCFHLIKNDQEAEQLLSEQELKFLRRYAQLRYGYFKDHIFKHFMKNYRDFKGIEIIFAKSEEQQRERKVMVDTKQSQVELKSPNFNEHVFAEILTNPKQLRFGLDLHASNTNTEQMEVISPGTIIFGPYRHIADRLAPSQFKLI